MNFVLLIGQEIGWQEIIFIGVLALIIFGPRKLPQLGRTAGKYMAEFRRATREFKSTWESEVSSIKGDFKEDDPGNDTRMLAYLENPKPVENSIGRNQGEGGENGNSIKGEQLELPSIREVEPEQPAIAEETAPAETTRESKKDWL